MKNLMRANVVDHRGNVRSMVSMWFFIEATYSSDRRRRLEDANKEWYKSRSWLSQTFLFAVSAIALFSGVSLVAWMTSALSLNLLASAALSTLSGLALGLALVHTSIRLASRQVVLVCSAAGYCASCGYDLRGVAEDATTADGCRVCPECSAACRIDAATQR